MDEKAAEPRFPSSLEHQHGLSEWWPMLPERSAETITPEGTLPDRLYRCQAVGCGEVVKLDASSLGE
jgi:hypothetical protein